MKKTNNSKYSLTNNISRRSIEFYLILTLSLSGLAACSGQVKTEEASNYNAELGIRYLQKNRLKRASEKLLKAIEQNPESAKSNHYFALLQAKLGDNKKALKYFSKAVELDPKDSELRNNYGSFLCKRNKPKIAVQQFLLAIKDPLYETPEFAYTNAGICLRKANNHAQAEKYFRQALKKKKSFPAALLEMARLYNDRKIYPKAQAFMFRYEKVGRSSPEALQLCSVINKKMKDNTKASRCKTTLLRLFPDSKEAVQISKSF
ncbi:MAG TPA: type IV pilus biogenesis/stability protein PilW [Leucothrix sp.]|nr:type IV pilus biogenesis/stability protein PilW [Leucothrix sp.]